MKETQKALRDLMKEKGISHTQLADALGLSKYGLSKKMTGKNTFTWDEVCVICEMLEIENPVGIIEARKERTRCC